MAQKTYVYQFDGVTQAYLDQQVPGTGSVSDSVPPRYQEVTWDETYKGDLDAAMGSSGWRYLYEGAAPAAKTIAQIQTSVLASDGSAIGTADGWVSVLTKTLTTQGASAVGVQCTSVADISGVTGQATARVIVNGGSFPADTIVGAPGGYDIAGDGGHGSLGFNAPRAIADTSPTNTTYTFELQLSVTGIGSSLTPRAGSVMTLVEYR